ncbi:MAG TPA: hypothetical protein VIF43_04415 [Patescibacteria group bacterium]|jgi:hypothetical protein
MGDLRFLTKDREERSTGSGAARRERTFVRMSAVCLALFGALFVFGLILGSAGEQEWGKPVGLSGFGCLALAGGLYWYRDPSPERRYVVQWATFLGSYVVLAAGLAAGCGLLGSLDLTGPWAALRNIALLAMLAAAGFIALVLRAKFDPRLSDGTDPYA